MSETLDLGLPEASAGTDPDNISDWALEQFQAKYGPEITKDGIWEYLYGIMHSPDWRMDYRHDLQRNLPRIPLADDFEAFRSAGRELMDLHIGYETVDEYPVQCLVDGEPDNGDADHSAYRIEGRMRWGKRPDGSDDPTVLMVNSRCRLVGIPLETVHYTVSGRTPLQWAIDSLRVKHDKPSGIVDDPNGWRDWADEPFNLIRHLRRLVRVSYESALIIAWLPTSRPGESHLYEPGPVTLADIIESQGKGPPLDDSTGIIYTEEEFAAHLESLLDEPSIE
ncbi:type ISP restriction/modification enzyme [Candidatus Poriferisodalis sp.]|uniref:type ISP restriction/modification enzyme n=1 Tax=Candidatus Poriferisodalis sp. TaxID=3101277 RepID=UPI003B01199A